MFVKGVTKRGQVTIFVIIGIVIVVAVLLFLLLRKESVTELPSMPSSLEGPYSSFLGCLNDDTSVGISLLESQGGYIEIPDFEPGSSYMPFSNQLNFAGTQIPYWYYISTGNVQKEQVPSKKNMEEELGSFIEERISDCKFDTYSGMGYNLELGEPKVEVQILDEEVIVNLEMDFNIDISGEGASVKKHQIKVDSNLGKFYSAAIKIYEKEQSELFLENYGIDVLNLYAPVDGFKMSCSPLVWDADKVFDDISAAIEANTLALKTKGDSGDYFFIGVDSSDNIRFLNSRNWSSTYEVNPTDGQLMISMPVGNQPGLGLLGFCYVNYHYVYDLKYPILVQIYDDNEIFQFPLAVVIQGNKAREPLTSSAVERQIVDFCQYKNTNTVVRIFDSNNNPIKTDADVSYDCSGTSCYIGKTTNGYLEADFPQCVNGRVSVRADGFVDGKITYSTVNEGSVGVYLDKLYTFDLEITLDGKAYNKEVILNFISDNISKSVLYPDFEEVELSPGEYEITAYIYDDSSLKLGSSVSQQCVEVSKGGLAGLFGFTEKKCYDVEMPEQFVSRVLIGGGKAKVYALDEMLSRSNKISIDAESLSKPESLEELQLNYILFEDKVLEVDFS